MPRGRELVNQKERVVTSKVSETGLALEPIVITIPRHEEELELESREAENVLPGNQEIDKVGHVHQDAPLDPEILRREEAVTKAQAAFRGYLGNVCFIMQLQSTTKVES